MGRDWKKWAADKGIRKWFRKDNFIILILMGILLVIIALPTNDSAQKEAGFKAGKVIFCLFPGRTRTAGTRGTVHQEMTAAKRLTQHIWKNA